MSEDIYVLTIELFNDLMNRFGTKTPTFRDRLMREAHPNMDMPKAEIAPCSLRAAVIATLYLHLDCPVDDLAAYLPPDVEPMSPRSLCNAVLLFSLNKFSVDEYPEDGELKDPEWESNDELRNFTMKAFTKLYAEIERARDGAFPEDGEQPERTTLTGYRSNQDADEAAWDELVSRVEWLKTVRRQGYEVAHKDAMRIVMTENEGEALRTFARLAAKTKLDRYKFRKLATVVAGAYSWG